MVISNLTWLIIFSFMYVIALSFLYFSKTRLDNGENKIYKYYKLDNKKLIYKSNTTKNYVYFIYKIKSND